MGQGWRIELLGEVAAVRDERRISRFRTQRGKLLLALLALRPGRVLSRDELGERLWPDEDPQRQRLRLRGELTELRTSLGEDIFERRGNAGLAVRADVVSDVSLFEAHLLAAARAAVPERRAPELQAAAALYRGDLLPGLYDDWSVAERERLRAAHADLSLRWIVDLEALGRREEAQVVRRETAARYPDRELPPAAPDTSTGNRYFGRDADRAPLAEWARRGDTRLITLVGPGGIGKTRLARVTLPDATFVPLANVDHGAAIHHAIHQALRLPEGGAPVEEQVRNHLRRHPCLLLLDNVEQLVDVGAPTVIAGLLDACPAVRITVTSRRPLQLPAERLQPVGPLERSAAVDLFLDRARRARPDFGGGDALAAVERLVDLLDGLPLAIEIAAARTVALGVRQIQEQLEHQLRFLVNRRHTDDDRHRSLRAALDWSWNLLEPDLQRAFARLSTFRGGWSLDSARIVCEREDAAEILDALQAHSLAIVSFDATDTPRYDLLTVVREYAAERLAESGDEPLARERHADALTQIGGRVAAAVRDAGGVPESQAMLGREMANLRHSIPWAIQNERYDLLYRWLDTMGGGLFERGRWQEFSALMDAVDGHITDKRALMRLCSLRGALLRRQGKEDSAALYWDRWLGLAEELGDPMAMQRALTQLTLQCLDRSDVDGALAYFRRLEHDTDATVATTIRCRLCLLQGDRAEARRWAEAVLTHAAEDPARNQAPLLYVIEVLVGLGELHTALHWITTLLPLSDGTASTYHSIRLLDLAAPTLEALGRVREASHALALAERGHEELGSRFLKGARTARAQFRARHPEADAWDRTPHQTMWDEVRAALADPVYVLSTPAS